MNRKRQMVTAAVLSASVGLGTHSIFAQSQSAPSGGIPAPAKPGQPGPTFPQSDPNAPRPVEPTIPGRPAPVPTPGLPQTDPMPGQPGSPVDRTQRPGAGERQDNVVTPAHIKSAQEALRAQGFNPGADGRMDTKTQEALRDFQKKNNLPATGVLDEKTAAKLGVNSNVEGRSTQGRGSSFPK